MYEVAMTITLDGDEVATMDVHMLGNDHYAFADWDRQSGVANDGKTAIRMILPYPVSANRYWRVFRSRVCHSKEALDYRRDVALIALRRGHAKPFTGDVSVSIALCPHLTKKGVASEVRIDLDNCLKVVLDALQGVAFNNDKQIVELRATLGPAQVGGALMVEVAEV